MERQKDAIPMNHLQINIKVQKITKTLLPYIDVGFDRKLLKYAFASKTLVTPKLTANM